MAPIAMTALNEAWSQVLTDFGGKYAVSIAWNVHFPGTSSSCIRITPDGTRVRMPHSGVAARYGVDRVSGARHISADRVRLDLDRLHQRVDRKLFGTRFHSLPGSERSRFLGFVEHFGTNVHAHVAWSVPDARASEFTDVVSTMWRGFGPSGTVVVRPIRDAGWSNYILKDQWGEALNDAALFVASRALRG